METEQEKTMRYLKRVPFVVVDQLIAHIRLKMWASNDMNEVRRLSNTVDDVLDQAGWTKDEYEEEARRYYEIVQQFIESRRSE